MSESALRTRAKFTTRFVVRPEELPELEELEEITPSVSLFLSHHPLSCTLS